jgi:predicted ATP-binding protein involved in virulence
MKRPIVTVIAGPNGTGKTSLLRLIIIRKILLYLLSHLLFLRKNETYNH